MSGPSFDTTVPASERQNVLDWLIERGKITPEEAAGAIVCRPDEGADGRIALESAYEVAEAAVLAATGDDFEALDAAQVARRRAAADLDAYREGS